MIKDLWLVLTGKLSLNMLEDSALKEHNLRAHVNQLVQQAQIERRKLLEPISIAVGRLVAKLDPAYISDELDPGRRAASDDIGRKAMARITAEATARRKMEGRE